MEIKEYSTLTKVPKLNHHSRMPINAIFQIPLLWGLIPLQGLLSVFQARPTGGRQGVYRNILNLPHSLKYVPAAILLASVILLFLVESRALQKFMDQNFISIGILCPQWSSFNVIEELIKNLKLKKKIKKINR